MEICRSVLVVLGLSRYQVLLVIFLHILFLSGLDDAFMIFHAGSALKHLHCVNAEYTEYTIPLQPIVPGFHLDTIPTLYIKHKPLTSREVFTSSWPSINK